MREQSPGGVERGSPLSLAMIAGTYAPERCGVAHYAARLREELIRQGLPSEVLTDQNAPAAPDVRPVVSGWRGRSMPAIVRAIRRTAPRILHIQHAPGTYGFHRSLFWLPPLLRASGWHGPIVTTVHEYGNWEWQPPRPWRPLLNRLKEWGESRGWWEREDGFLLTQSDAVIVTHPETAELLRSRIPALAERLHQIPIGSNIECAPADVQEARARLRASYGWGPSAQVIAFFGFLHPVKGLENLLHAFHKVVGKLPEARLLLIGGVESLALRGTEADRYWGSLHRQVEQLGLRHLVQLTGYVDDKAASELLWGCDIGTLPFNYGLNLKSGSLLALMAHGLPIVATRHQPAVPEFENDDLVRLVPSRDIAALADALIGLLRDSGDRKRLAANGRRFVERFSWPGIAAQHVALYASLRPFFLAENQLPK